MSKNCVAHAARVCKSHGDAFQNNSGADCSGCTLLSRQFLRWVLCAALSADVITISGDNHMARFKSPVGVPWYGNRGSVKEVITKKGTQYQELCVLPFFSLGFWLYTWTVKHIADMSFVISQESLLEWLHLPRGISDKETEEMTLGGKGETPLFLIHMMNNENSVRIMHHIMRWRKIL